MLIKIRRLVVESISVDKQVSRSIIDGNHGRAGRVRDSYYTARLNAPLCTSGTELNDSSFHVIGSRSRRACSAGSAGRERDSRYGAWLNTLLGISEIENDGSSSHIIGAKSGISRYGGKNSTDASPLLHVYQCPSIRVCLN